MNRTTLKLLLATALAAGTWSALGATVTVSGYLRGEHTWTADNEYLLDGWVYVVDGAVLNIEAGTVIRGKEAAAPPDYGALFICRGGKIHALGSPANPIIFTTQSDDLADPYDLPLEAEPTGRGLWGGVVILGKGLINRPDAEASGSGRNPDGSWYQLYEGLQDATDPETGQGLHRFGGNDNDDSSGALRFVSIRYAGKALDANKELNSLSLAGVGRGTVVEFVEVYAGADDGFEIFGGAVHTRYLVASFHSDECFDIDQGHEGKHQFWFGFQGFSADEGMELNGQPSGGANVNEPGAEPLGRHQIYNVTLIGEGGSGTGSDVMNTRSDYYGSIHNSVFLQFQGRDQVSSVPTYQGTVTHNLFWENVGGRGMVDEANNAFADPKLRAIDRGQNGTLDPRPLPDSPVFTGYKTPPADGFFIAADYKGAFKDALWFQDWTALAQNRHTRLVAHALVCEPPAVAGPVAPMVSAQRDGNNLVLTWTGTAASYRVQKKASLNDTDWTDLATTTDNTYTVPIEGETGFFRVVQP